MYSQCKKGIPFNCYVLAGQEKNEIHLPEISVFTCLHLNRGFNKFFYNQLLQVDQAAVTTKGAMRPLATRGVLGHAPGPEKLKFRSSEMQFPAFQASKRVLFMIIFIDQMSTVFEEANNVFIYLLIQFQKSQK